VDERFKVSKVSRDERTGDILVGGMLGGYGFVTLRIDARSWARITDAAERYARLRGVKRLMTREKSI
jgi:hypothetical protein